MNHCFQCLTGSFFSPFLFAFFLPLPSFSTLLSLSFFSPLCCSLSLSVGLSRTSPGTRIGGDVFTVVNIFQSVVLGQVNKAVLLFSVTQKRNRYVDYFFLVTEAGQVLFRMCVCVCVWRKTAHTSVCLHVHDWRGSGGPAPCLLLTPTRCNMYELL